MGLRTLRSAFAAPSYLFSPGDILIGRRDVPYDLHVFLQTDVGFEDGEDGWGPKYFRKLLTFPHDGIHVVVAVPGPEPRYNYQVIVTASDGRVIRGWMSEETLSSPHRFYSYKGKS